MFGRPLPVGDSHRALGGLINIDPSLTRSLLDSVDESDPYRAVEILGAALRPPRLTNTEGHDLVLITQHWALPDAFAADGLGSALVTAGFDEVEPGRAWNLLAGRRSVVAAARFDEELTIEVNSEERSMELADLIRSAVAGAAIADLDVTELDDLDRGEGSEGSVGAPDLDDPELRAALEQHILEYEAEWIETSVPALGGRTPREATADPVGREEVLQLLATFPEPPPEQPGMSASRLRAALGLWEL